MNKREQKNENIDTTKIKQQNVVSPTKYSPVRGFHTPPLQLHLEHTNKRNNDNNLGSDT
jgi:hypothetical protein